MEERERQKGSCPVDRGISEELEEVKMRLTWVALPMATVKSGSGLFCN